MRVFTILGVVGGAVWLQAASVWAVGGYASVKRGGAADAGSARGHS